VDLQELFKKKFVWTERDSLIFVIGLVGTGLIVLAYSLLIISTIFTPADFATCIVSFEGNFDGVIDLNKEALAANNWVNEFEINSLSGGVTITAPCSLLQDRGLLQ